MNEKLNYFFNDKTSPFNIVYTIIDKIKKATISMEGISASTEEQTASMEEITSTANRLGTLAENLKEKLQT